MNILDYINQLDNNSNQLLSIAKSCSLNQLIFKEEGKWSILEILEHVSITDSAIFSLLTKPSDRLHSTSEIFGNGKLNHVMVNKRSYKVSSPEGLLPKGIIKDIASFEAIFLKNREGFKENLLSEKIQIDNRIHKHTHLGDMTISDWLYFIIHHSQRHVEQIKDIITEAKNN